MAQILDGKIVAKNIRQESASIVSTLKSQGKTVKLAIVLANDDPSSLSYVNSIVKTGQKIGIECFVEKPNVLSQSTLETIISKLAHDKTVDGIMLQTPLPTELSFDKLSALIPVEKDIDGLNPESAGRLSQGLDCFAPATAQAVMEILKFYDIELLGRRVAVVGRSNIVGKPLLQLLLAANASVSICHSKTIEIFNITSLADILVVAIGKSKYISSQFVNSKQTVIDVGTNFDESGKMTGDVDFDNVEPLVQAITPVPGGVGPVTTAVLLKQVCQAARISL